jgi:23S rRNA pseudouridine1911/1915/1917 synthase
MTEKFQPVQRQESIVPAELAGVRLDVALAKLFSFSRTSLQQWIEEGFVHVNGAAQKKRYVVEEGDLLSVYPMLPPPLQVVPEQMSFEVLYEDSAMFIINKPVGLVVHPAPGNEKGTFVNGLVAHLSDLECIDPIRPGIVHRLDKDTSGVLIAAKTPSALCALSKQFHDRTVHKEYLAIVVGCCKNRMECSLPIGRDPKNRQKMAIVEGGKEAYTEIFPLHISKDWTVVKAVPRTGRTHQIRVHLASLKIPILGDIVYGDQHVNAKWNAVRQMLHCRSISFVHPITGESLTIEAPVPEDMQKILRNSICA